MMTESQKRISFNFSNKKDVEAKSFYNTFIKCSDGTYITRTLKSCLQDIKEYRSASTGTGHYSREAICIDSDHEMTDSEFLSSIRNDGLPEPNYVTTHTDNNHHQAIYFIAPIHYVNSLHDMYLNVTFRFNMNVGDRNFNGWRCDNIYYDGPNFYSTKICDELYSLFELDKKYHIDRKDYPRASSKSKSKDKAKAKSTVKAQHNSSTSIYDNTSRNSLEMKYVYDYLRKMYKYTGSLPTMSDTINYMLSVKYEIAKIAGKDCHEDAEIIRTTKACYNKGADTFNYNMSKFNDSDRERAKAVKKVSKLSLQVKVLELREKKQTYKNIAETLKISVVYAKKLNNISKEELLENITELKETLNNLKNKDFSFEKNYFEKYNELLKEIEDLSNRSIFNLIYLKDSIPFTETDNIITYNDKISSLKQQNIGDNNDRRRKES